MLAIDVFDIQCHCHSPIIKINDKLCIWSDGWYGVNSIRPIYSKRTQIGPIIMPKEEKMSSPVPTIIEMKGRALVLNCSSFRQFQEQQTWISGLIWIYHVGDKFVSKLRTRKDPILDKMSHRFFTTQNSLPLGIT